MRNFIGAILLVTSVWLGISSTSAQPNIEESVLGTHPLSLQWLDDHAPRGAATISRRDGQLIIDGRQEGKSKAGTDFMTLQGTLRVVSAKELEFNGTIVTRVEFINGGAPYERKGKFRWLATGKRQYWRMQKMTQPDTESEVTDYIDLFFVRKQ